MGYSNNRVCGKFLVLQKKINLQCQRIKISNRSNSFLNKWISKAVNIGSCFICSNALKTCKISFFEYEILNKPKTSIGERRKIARARQISCFWPTEKSEPHSETVLSSLEENDWILVFNCTLSIASHSSASLFSLKGSRFRRIVPEKRIGSCGMIARPFLNLARLTSAVSMLSIRIWPVGWVSLKLMKFKMFLQWNVYLPEKSGDQTWFTSSCSSDNPNFFAGINFKI